MEESSQSLVRLADRYELLRPIGRGGSAVVYQAMDTTLERIVALKILRQDFTQDDQLRARFHQEAKAVANLSHPNIIMVYDFGFDKGNLFMVMEYLKAQDLKMLIRQRRQFSIEETVQLLFQACSGIGYAHRAGIVHCDVKPHNILVTESGKVKVADFGIAYALKKIDTVQRSQTVWGSPQYFSPEQIQGKPPLPSSDVYSLGIILYEMLTGELPFKAADTRTLMQQHLYDQPVSPHAINAAIPPELDYVILKALSKEPSVRYRNADQLGNILLSFTQQERQMPTEAESDLSTVMQREIDEADEQPTSDLASEEPLDFVTLGLGLIAFIAVGGLVPFWLYIVLSIRSIIR